MRVVITGGSGLIGSAVAAPLAAEGNEVVVLSRDPARVRGLPAGVRAAHWDGRSAAGWETLLDGRSAVINLAGEPVAAGRWTAERKRRVRASRLDAGRAVVDAVRRAAGEGRAPAVVVQASGIGYYGDTGDQEIGEDHPPGGDFLAETSVAWEASTAEVETLGVRRVVLRTGIVLDRGGGALAKMLPLFRLGLGGPLGNGRQWFPWIHMADEVGAILFLLAAPAATGPFNLCAPRPARNRDFARALGRQLHRPSILPAPAPVLRLALGDMAEALLTGQHAEPRRLLEAGYRFCFPDLPEALADLLAQGHA
jgi:uncharacterized protein (TIGR01777 family)